VPPRAKPLRRPGSDAQAGGRESVQRAYSFARAHRYRVKVGGARKERTLGRGKRGALGGGWGLSCSSEALEEEGLLTLQEKRGVIRHQKGLNA